MKTLMAFTQYEIGIVLAVLAAVVVFQLLTGRINTRGLLSEKTSTGIGPVSPARVQLLLFTLAIAFYLLSQVIQSIKGSPPGVPISFPDIETKWLVILGGSHSIYLGGKGLTLLRSQLKSAPEGD
jgi:hypothetical protein